jgi:hypothetical protein
MPEQLTLVAVNPIVAPDKLAEGEVATATNIDFSLEPGAACVRRGSEFINDVSFGQVNWIRKHYRANIANSQFYVAASNGYCKRFDTLEGTGAGITVVDNGSTDILGIAKYGDKTFIASGAATKYIADDGTLSSEWPLRAPSGTLGVAVSTLAPLSVTGVYTVTEGTLTAGGTSTATAVTTGSNYRISFAATPTSTNLNTNTARIGDYGVDVLKIMFDNPSVVYKVSRDYSIGDANFTNYFHTEMDLTVDETVSAFPDEQVLLEALGTFGSNTALDNETREQMLAEVREQMRAPAIRISAAANTFNSWAVPRTNFDLVSVSPQPNGWENIGAVRIIVEASAPVTVTVAEWVVQGSEAFPLNDADVGYNYWETFAIVEGGEIVAESAPSPMAGPKKMQFAQAVLTSTNTATATQTFVAMVHPGMTHRVFYRQGGFLPEPYAIGTVAIATATFTDAMADITAVAGRRRLNTNIRSRADFPQNAAGLTVHYDRLFLLAGNKLYWSLPGQPYVFPRTSFATVSAAGDEGRGLVAWPPGLVIVNYDSVYELSGNIFEGPNTNWNLVRTGSKHGSKAYKTIIHTPYGIPLLDYDGLYFYQPGQGVDVPLSWANEAMADAWLGTGTGDPAALKGSRIPAINKGFLNESCAEFCGDKLYLAMPTGTATRPDTVFVLNFATKRVQWYRYPWQVTSLYWDNYAARLLAGANTSSIFKLEVGATDRDSSDAVVPITWSVRTRSWTTPSDTVLENISAEYKGGTGVLKGIYDGTSTVTLGTLTNTNRDWLIPGLHGTIANNVAFDLSGTGIATLYGVGFDAIQEPPRITYLRTPHDVREPEHLWDVHYADMEITGTGSVTGVVFLDGVAVATHTYTGPSARKVRPNSLPSERYGSVAYTTYTGVEFKHWQSKFDARPEPPRVNSFKTDIQSLDEQICDAVDADLNPNGTSTVIAYIDSVPVGTFTATGTNRQSYTWALPNETYGRTIYAVHSGSGLKHYNTWFHLRQEPDRWANFVSDRRGDNEQRFDRFECELNPLGGTVLATAMIDGTAVGTFTCTGSLRQSFAFALPVETYGRTYWTIYNAVGSGRFKYFKDWYEGTPEPDRVSTVQVGPFMKASGQDLSTWLVDINPLGTALGTVFADDVLLAVATFTGTTRKSFSIGQDVNTALTLQDGTKLHAVYNASAGGKLKHYETHFATDPHPFEKKTWAIGYKKLGGATQLDMARFWNYDIDAGAGTATVTSVWDLDGVAFQTNTFTVVGRQYRDRIPFAPGGRYYLIQQRLLSSIPIKIYSVGLDIDRIGVKGFSRATIAGEPRGS